MKKRAQLRLPGRLYVAPAPVLATGLLLVNDHVLKSRWQNVATGKLSDLAGLYFVPLLAVALVEVVLAASGRSWATSPQRLHCSLVLTGFGFAAVKLSSVAADVYGYAVGCIRWPVHVSASLIGGQAVPGISRAVVLADWTDLIALPLLWLSWRSGRRWTVPPFRRRIASHP